MSTDRELAMTDYIIDTGFALQEMRLLVEGAALLAEEASPLLALARAHDQHELAETLSTIDTALSRLRDLVCDLQKSYADEIRQQIAAESP